ncbi:MAG: TetR/AcrR family transcriptional regulator, partial [Thermosynechococcaceae cyanobacterium]
PTLSSDQKTHQRILEAAEHLFASQGYERTTTKQLAEASGVAEGTLFRYFESKKAILAAVMGNGWNTLLNDLLATLCEVSDYQDMVTLLRHRLQDFQQHADLVKVCLIQTPFHPDLCEALQRERLGQMLAVLEAYIQTGIDRGMYRPLNPSSVAQVLLVMFLGMGWIDNTLINSDDSTQHQVQMADTLADILMHGLLLHPTVSPPSGTVSYPAATSSIASAG